MEGIALAVARLWTAHDTMRNALVKGAPTFAAAWASRFFQKEMPNA
jgi:hypothetical protein